MEEQLAEDEDCDSDNEIVGESDNNEEAVPELIDGQKVRYDFHVRKDGTVYRRLLIQCRHHPDCGRSRNFGSRTLAEVVGFLTLWHMGGENITLGEHRKLNPSDAEVHRWVRENE